MKAIILCFRDCDPGAMANDIVLRADVVFAGSDVPGGAMSSSGPEMNGIPINLNLGGMTQSSYSNAIEAACIAEAARLGLPTLANNDVFLPTYTRGT